MKNKEVVKLSVKAQNQFVVSEGDLFELQSDREFSTTSLITALVQIEFSHPGILAFVVRMMALAIDGWTFTATASDPKRSLKVQRELIEYIQELDQAFGTR